ncbi:hypothetical protein D3C77_689630 [compost metagenome]
MPDVLEQAADSGIGLCHSLLLQLLKLLVLLLDVATQVLITTKQLTGTVLDFHRHAGVMGDACALGDQRRGNERQKQLVELAARH